MDMRHVRPSETCLGAADQADARIQILMATFNGGAHLSEQLESIAAQTHANWSLWISDDGSTDATLDLVARFKSQGHDVTLVEGPRQGSTANFMSLIRGVQLSPEASWLAFCDQDDVWLPDKLERAVEALLETPADQAALYCSRTYVTDDDLQGRSLSSGRPRPLGFRNALVQNVASGNTTVLNPAAARLVQGESARAGAVVVHDWWVYQLVSGAGGRLVHDDTPSLLYRQHESNAIGVNTGFAARLRRIRMLLDGSFGRWNAMNIAALLRSSDQFTSENQRIVQDFSELRHAPLFRRLGLLYQLELYRQSTLSTVALWIAAVLRRL